MLRLGLTHVSKTGLRLLIPSIRRFLIWPNIDTEQMINYKGGIGKLIEVIE